MDRSGGFQGRLGWAVVLACVALAYGVRLVYLGQLQATPYVDQLVIDEEAYDQRARAIVDGVDGGSGRPYYQDPLYPYLLAGVYRCGGGWGAVRHLQALVASIGAGAVAAAAMLLAGPIAGGAAGALVAFGPDFLFYDGQIDKTSLTASLTAMALLVWLWAVAGPSRGRWLLAGVGLGLLALLRGNFLAIAPIAIAGVWFGTRRLGLMLVCAGGFMLAVAPVTIRNWWVSGELVAVTSQGGQNFYIGNWSGNDSGTYQPPPFLRPHPAFEESDLAKEAERRAGRSLTATEVSRFYWRLTLDEIGADPLRFLRRTLLRIAWTLHPVDVPDNHDRRFMARFVPLLATPWPATWLVLALGLPGLLLAQASRPAGWLPMGFVATYGASLVPFFVFGRYRTPLLIGLAVAAGVTVARLVATARTGAWARVAGILTLVLGIGGGLSLLPPVPSSDSQNWNTLGIVHERRGEWEAAVAAFRSAVAAGPDDPYALYNLARVTAAAGDRAAAIRWYQECLRLRPSLAAAHANLGALLLDLGRLGEARAALAEALLIDSQLAEAAFNIGLVAERLGRPLEAIAAYRQVVDIVGAGSSLGRNARLRAAALENPPPAVESSE